MLRKLGLFYGCFITLVLNITGDFIAEVVIYECVYN